jgi:hypothetical protein
VDLELLRGRCLARFAAQRAIGWAVRSKCE